VKVFPVEAVLGARSSSGGMEAAHDGGKKLHGQRIATKK
jgi:hypothetical protein